MEGGGCLGDPLRCLVRVEVRGYGLRLRSCRHRDAARCSGGFGVFGRRIVPIPTLHDGCWKTAATSTTTTAYASCVLIAKICSLIVRWRVAVVRISRLLTTALAARLRETRGHLGASLSQGVWSVKQLGLPPPVLTEPAHGLDPGVP